MEPGQWLSLEEVGDDEPVYGSLPAERYKTVDLALKRMTQLLAEEAQAEVGGVALRELRELHGLSQIDLGVKLGIKQAAVSRVERRSDLHLDTLMAIVQALGGTLEIRAPFELSDDEQAAIEAEGSARKEWEMAHFNERAEQVATVWK